MPTPIHAPHVDLASEPLPQWQLQDAKNRFSAMVKAAAQGEPQLVTVHGHAAAVVLSPERYAALLQAQAPQDRLSDALACPVVDDDENLFERDRSHNAKRDVLL